MVALLAQFDFIALIPIAIFGLFAAGAWVLLGALAARKPRAEERLDVISDPRKHRQAKANAPVSTTDAMTKMLEKATPALAKPLQPKDEKSVGKLKLRLTSGGFRSESAPTVFLGLKFIGLILGGTFASGIMLFLTGVNQTSIVRTVLVAGVLFYLPDVLLWWISKQRRDNIFLGLPDALDLMVVCVEAGLGLDQAMRRVAEELRKSYRIIAEEFALCNFHLQMGRSRAEVLHELGQRTRVEDLRSLSSIIIQADKFGSSIGQALRVQSDSMRTRRRQLAEERAAKTAVKLIFPLVLFIFPGIFVVLVGPAAITMINEMFPAMSGSASF